jgi:hypothetical protein
MRAVFAEMNRSADQDHLFVLNYDGEFRTASRAAVAAGTAYAEEQAEASLLAAPPTTLADALSVSITAWGIARSQLAPKPNRSKDDDEYDPLGDLAATGSAPPVSDDPAVAVREALKNGALIEAGLLQRSTTRESKFRLLTEAELASPLAAFR